ncbi:MAG: M3 family metallopeptidase [Myxococcota bacterium]
MNPLLGDHYPIPFGDIETEHVRPAITTLLAAAAAAREAYATDDGSPSFERTVLGFDRITERLGRVMTIVSHLESVCSSDALRAVYNETRPKVSEFQNALPLDPRIWAKMKVYAATDEARGLEGARRRYLDQTLRAFRRLGAELPADEKTRLQTVSDELTKLTLQYSQNVLDSTNAYALPLEEADLEGLPERARAAARAAAVERDQEEGFVLTLQAPSFVPAMTYLERADLREKLYRALSTRATRAPHDNRAVLARILELRREKATLLGYATFADMVLEERMAKSGATAHDFVTALEARTRPAFERETEELQAYRREIEGDDAPPLEPWDLAFYAEKLRRARYAFDEEMIRPYFAFERVLEGVFSLAEALFGVTFAPTDAVAGWHESVRPYTLRDGDGRDGDGTELATVYVDPYPRETKRGGAWMHGLLGRGRIEDDPRHVAVLCANVTPPLDDQPALLSHRDVETMFHEAGHLLHHCLSRAELPGHAGTNVAWDFVELPSQILENWCWERASLDLFARHHETGATIPDDLLAAMRKARTFRAATAQMRQLGFASTDLALHRRYDPAADGDPVAFARTEMARFAPVGLPDGYAMIASFGHLFADPVGYAAGYYSYKWAEVLDADAFTRFAEAGILDRATGRAFREHILERGDERDPSELFIAFMGRAPSQDALLQRLGLG